MNDSADHPETGVAADEAAPARRRLRGFAIHMAAYFVVVIALGAVNLTTTPDNLWFVFPMVLWGAPLALHAAYAMGLLKAFR